MKRLVLNACAVAAALLISTGVPDVASALLGPSRASNLVTLRYFSTTPCPFFATGLVLDRRWMPDATYVQPFVIPEGKVLIVTDVQMSLAGLPPNSGTLVQLLLVDPSNGNSSPIVQFSVATDSTGHWSENITLPTGAAVKPGMVLCEPSGVMVDTIVHGYLAADR